VRKKDEVTLYNGGILIGVVLILIAWAIDMKNYPPKDPKSHWPSYPKISVSRTYVSRRSSNSIFSYTQQTEREKETTPNYFEKWQQEQIKDSSSENLESSESFNYLNFGDSEDNKGRYLGKLSVNPYNSDSVFNPYGEYGSKYSPDSINNPYGKYGSKYSSYSVNNPYATDAPKLYDSEGNYRGKLSNNPYDPDSISNPYGRYGSKYSPDSINNPYGAGNPYKFDSPYNPYGEGWKIYGDNE